MSRNPWSFVYVADMQPGSPKSYRFRQAFLDNWRTAQRQIVDVEPDFMLIGGDITRDGTIHAWELEEMKSDLDAMRIPYHAIPGNMDVGNKFTDTEGPDRNRRDTEICINSELLKQYETVFGASMWSFTHKNVRVSGFCDMLLGAGLPEEQELKRWLEEQRSKQASEEKKEHRIWLMHYALFVDAPNERSWDITKEDEYTSWYFTVDQGHRDWLMRLFVDTRADRVLTGHIHCAKDHIANGVHFDLAPATAFSQWADHWPDGDPSLGFYRFDVDGDTLTRTFVPLERVSTNTAGYGPGGHPPPEMRDYSLAWE